MLRRSAPARASGLRNPNFFPLRTPYPYMAIRHKAPGDFVFMTLEDYEPALSKRLLEGFLDVFGEEKENPKVQPAVEEYEKVCAALLEKA